MGGPLGCRGFDVKVVLRYHLTMAKAEHPKPIARKKARSTSASSAKRNVRAIANLEHEALHHRSATARISDVVCQFAGSGSFILLHAGWFTGWVLLNLGKVPGVEPFDPYPFTFLTMIVSLEAIFLSIFVLISQNRMAHQADRRAHLDLQINLLAEEENTTILRMLRALCQKQGIDLESMLEDGDDAKDLLRKTDIQALMKDLEKQLPEEM
jgi:uncharacterized membrane protein